MVCYSSEPDFVPKGIPWPKIDPNKEELDYLYAGGPGKMKMMSSANLGDKKFWESIDFNENKLNGQ